MRITYILVFTMLCYSSALSAEVMLRWLKPTSGSPVVFYETQYTTDGGNTWVFSPNVDAPDTQVVYNIVPNVEHIARVRGVDSLDRRGQWSEESEPYTYGEPGKPITVELRR